MENENKNEKDYAEYRHDKKLVRFGGKPAIIVSVFAGVSLVGLAGGITYIITKNPGVANDMVSKIFNNATKNIA